MISQIEKNYKQFNNYPQNLNNKCRFHRVYFEEITEPKHKIELQIDVKNNVGFDVINELLNMHGANLIPNYWVEKGYTHPNLSVKDLLKNFLYIRNNTAHGNKIMTDVTINQADFEQYKNLILNLIYEVGRLLSECIHHKTYLKSN